MYLTILKYCLYLLLLLRLPDCREHTFQRHRCGSLPCGPTSIMKFLDCSALGGVLVPVTSENCDTILQQIKRALYQRIQASPLFNNTTVIVKATWDDPLTADDATLIVAPKKTAYSPEITGTEAVRIGSNDNSTPDGKSIVVGQSRAMIRFQYNGLSPVQYGQIETLFAQANATADFSSLWAYFLLGDDQILFADGGGGIPIVSATISDPVGGQLHSLTLFQVELELEKGWYRSAKVLKAPFKHSLLVNS